MSHDAGGIIYIYQLEGYQLRFDPHHCWLTKMVHYEPVQITINAPILAAGYRPRVFYEDIE